jgi:uncharacterized protein involved in tolerance to divalent cations
MKKKIVGIFLIFIVVLFLASGITLGYKYPSFYEYNGKILLTEQEYNQFKSDCASPNVTIKTITILDSYYPTLVTFNIRSTANNFPYGNENKVPGRWLFLICGSAVFGVISCAILVDEG